MPCRQGQHIRSYTLQPSQRPCFFALICGLILPLVCLQLQDAYAEVYRVLKPGSYFASYEWVSTKEYDPKNRDHVRIMDEINYGNGLPVWCINVTIS